MKYDEEIISAQNKYKKESVGDVYNGYLIKEVEFKFKKFSFFNDKISIYLPENFNDLPEAIAKIKYPSENRPQIIKSSNDNRINIAFNLLQVEMKNEDVIGTIHSFKNIIKNINPSNNFIDEGTIEISENHKLAWFDFLSNAIDGTLYTIISCMEVDGKMLHCVFNCSDEDMNNWKVVALDMLKSINI